MLDTLIKGGTVVDGADSEGFVADTGLRDDRIVAVGRIDESARNTIGAGGLHVLPGFADIHTHYDGQMSWDPKFTPSIFHCVTTLLMGNCSGARRATRRGRFITPAAKHATKEARGFAFNPTGAPSCESEALLEMRDPFGYAAKTINEQSPRIFRQSRRNLR